MTQQPFGFILPDPEEIAAVVTHAMRHTGAGAPEIEPCDCPRDLTRRWRGRRRLRIPLQHVRAIRQGDPRPLGDLAALRNLLWYRGDLAGELA